MRIKMLMTVRSDVPFLAKPGTVLRIGKEYEATANKNGAVSAICENGDQLGVKPCEFQFVSLPEWLFDIWSVAWPYSVEGAEIEVEA